jgi:hypothetical protein
MKSRRSSGPSRGDLCKKGGCKCYCHEPVKNDTWKMLVFLIVLGIVYVAALMELAHLGHVQIPPNHLLP